MQGSPENIKKGEPSEKTLQNLEENINYFEQTELDHFPGRLETETESLSKLIALAKDDKFSLGEIEVVRRKLESIKDGTESMICRVNSYIEARNKKIDIDLNK